MVVVVKVVQIPLPAVFVVAARTRDRAKWANDLRDTVVECPQEGSYTIDMHVDVVVKRAKPLWNSIPTKHGGCAPPVGFL